MSAAGAYPVSAEPLQRLHALLVEAVRRGRSGDPHEQPVTVAEIYQELAPYRTVRAALGLDMNADYEHTLLRLLSGEGRLARIEPAAAREQLERELESPNPNVALYRKFAGCDVWLLPSGSPTPAWVVAHLAEAELAVLSDLPAPAVTGVSGAGALVAEPAPTSPATSAGAPSSRLPEQPQDMSSHQEQTGQQAAPAAASRRLGVREREAGEAAGAEAGHCAFCDSLLPVFRQVRFCPFCGADQSQRPCGNCGEPLQPDWAFCIACGQAITATGA